MNDIDIEGIKPTVFYSFAQLIRKTGVGRRKLENMIQSGFMFFRENAQNKRLMVKGEWFIEALENPKYNAKKHAEYKQYLARLQERRNLRKTELKVV